MHWDFATTARTLPAVRLPPPWYRPEPSVPLHTPQPNSGRKAPPSRSGRPISPRLLQSDREILPVFQDSTNVRSLSSEVRSCARAGLDRQWNQILGNPDGGTTPVTGSA